VTARELLDAELDRLELDTPLQTRDRLAAYIDELQKWNRTLNLTALQGATLVRRLIAEPMWIGQQLQMSGVLADIGSGNGSPSIPLGLACSLRELHLIEVRAKRAAFLRHIVTKLGLENAVVHKVRVEEASDLPANLDWVTLQAVAPTRNLLNSLRRVVTDATRVVWITSRHSPTFETDDHLVVPQSETEVWLFHLDHS
jgi:16S rRNA (guanine527-N7)-methyltransferase